MYKMSLELYRTNGWTYSVLKGKKLRENFLLVISACNGCRL